MKNVLHSLDATMAPPSRFTFPFCYKPHPLCIAAAGEAQRYIASIGKWQEEICRGKMFGVLVVEHEGHTAFIAAYSGLLDGRCDHPWFVPPVYDSQQPDGHFKTREAEITAVNRRVAELECSDERKKAMARLDEVRRKAATETDRYKTLMAEAKARRDILRASGTATDHEALVRESQHMKAELRRLKQHYAERTAQAEADLKRIDSEITALKNRRHKMSDELQRWLFGQYRMLNALGEERDLNDIFAQATGHIPPSGAGDCCAPRLLQYAYRHGLRPLCMAEFWWGASPQGEIRHHLHYYPACRGKCKPILEHMLKGLNVDPDPQATDSSAAEELDIVYEDAHLAVVCKPSGMLSVPGRNDRRSVLSLMKNRCPEAEGPMMVHRLDMSTSGLIVVAKTTTAYHHLQAQFAAHTVRKRYVALLDGRPECPAEGIISLPLRPDPLDRPRQVVDHKHGKTAVTRYEIVNTDSNGNTLINLYPQTGRTHQLRMHCAHPDGLATPIVGDELYGNAAARLCLHAERIEFTHPATGKRMAFERKADFCKKNILLQ